MIRRPNGVLAGGTLYGRYLGDALAWLALAGTFAGVILSFRKKKASDAPSPETAS